LHPSQNETKCDHLISEEKNKKLRPKIVKTNKNVVNDSNIDTESSNIIDGFSDLFND
jgi:hypothetical protein